MLDTKKIIIPCNFDATAYLRELADQLPGKKGREEIGRQLALSIGRENPFNQSLIYNLLGDRQPMSQAFRTALWIHGTYSRAVKTLQGQSKT
jgi:hypothetical protein